MFTVVCALITSRTMKHSNSSIKIVVFILSILAFVSCQKAVDVSSKSSEDFGAIAWFSDTLKAADANTGNRILTRETRLDPFGSFIYNLTAKDSVIYQATTNYLTAVNIHTGALVFRHLYSSMYYSYGGNVASWPVVDGDKVYAASSESMSDGVKLFCHNKMTGAVIWSSSSYLGSLLGPGTKPFFPSPLISGNKVIISKNLYGGSSNSFGVYCFDKTIGTQLWSNISPYDFRDLTEFPLINGTKVFVVSTYDRKLYCLDLNTGNTIWVSNPLSTEPMRIEMRIYGNDIVVVSENGYGFNLNYVDINSGTVTNKFEFPEAGRIMQFDEDFIYTTNGVGSLYQDEVKKISLSSGLIAWNKLFANGFVAMPTVTANEIYCVEDGNPAFKLHILNKKDGTDLHDTVIPYDDGLIERFMVIDKNGEVFTNCKRNTY